MTEPAHSSDQAAANVPLVQLSGIWKHFGAGPPVLADVSLSIAPGEVHGLLGANGSGKSTLIKILAGFHDVDSGSLTIRGDDAPLPLVGDRAQALGLRFVHQDLGLLGGLSALENYLIPMISASRGRAVMGWRAQELRLRRILERYGLNFDPKTKVADLRPVDRALLAIVRALDGPGARSETGADTSVASLIVLDEPTVFLPQPEVDRLFDLVRRIAEAGSSILFVSHDLDEVRAVTDRVTVLRDGRVVTAGVPTSSMTRADLVRAIVGAELSVPDRESVSVGESSHSSDRMLHVQGLSVGAVGDIGFSASTGEVVGLTGLIGDGYEDVVEALAGAVPSQGRISLAGQHYELQHWSPAAAVRAGVVLVPADRLADAIAPELTVADNVTLPRLNSLRRGPLLSRRAMRRFAERVANRYDVRPRNFTGLMGQLSGGNQQKAVLGKWIETGPRILLLHEPTQGVDVGARQQIFRIIRETARKCVVLCASSDHEQLATLCDRVLIVRRGRIATELTKSELTKSRITTECLRPSLEQEWT